jgi:hypothetical protein
MCLPKEDGELEDFVSSSVVTPLAKTARKAGRIG